MSISTFNTIIPNINTINANTLRFGFFDGTTQWFHIVNIKIINDKNEDIAPSCVFTPTSTSVAYQSPGDLKTILTDNNEATFSHSELKSNSYIKVEFGKTVPIKQILVENRNNSDINRDRIKNAQFRLYDAADKIVYESDKITVGSKFYYLNMNSKVVNAGLPFIGDAMKAIADARATMNALINNAADVKIASDKKVAATMDSLISKAADIKIVNDQKVAATLKAVDDSKVVADLKAAAIDAIKPSTQVRDAVVVGAIKAEMGNGKTSAAAVIAAAADAIKPATDMRDNALIKSINDTTVLNAVKESVKESTEKRDKDLAKAINDVMSKPGKTADDVANAAVDSLSASTEKRDEGISSSIDSALPVTPPPTPSTSVDLPPPSTSVGIDPIYIFAAIVVCILLYFIFKPAEAAAPQPAAPQP